MPSTESCSGEWRLTNYEGKVYTSLDFVTWTVANGSAALFPTAECPSFFPIPARCTGNGCDATPAGAVKAGSEMLTGCGGGANRGDIAFVPMFCTLPLFYRRRSQLCPQAVLRRPGLGACVWGSVSSGGQDVWGSMSIGGQDWVCVGGWRLTHISALTAPPCYCSTPLVCMPTLLLTRPAPGTRLQASPCSSHSMQRRRTARRSSSEPVSCPSYTC
jgi:hypothetical protein